MKDTELHKERDRDLYRTYLRGLREVGFSNMHDAAEWVRQQPAPKFYISSKSLVNYIGAVNNGSVPPRMFKQNERRMKTLYRMYVEYMEEHPGCRTSREIICEDLVEMPAPEFYIGHESVIAILKRERRRHKEMMIRKYVK